MNAVTRVVMDANIFISMGIKPFGPPARAVRACAERSDIDVLVCPTLIGEVERRIMYDKRLTTLISRPRAHEILSYLRTRCHQLPDPSVVPRAAPQPKDDYLSALARQHDAALIVTGDKALQNWPEQNPPAVAPQEFLAGPLFDAGRGPIGEPSP